jgi:hypothetical protein
LPSQVSAVILNEEKDPEEFHSLQPPEPFNPNLSAIVFVLRIGGVGISTE